MYLPYVTTDAINVLVILKYHTAMSYFTNNLEYFMESVERSKYVTVLSAS